MLSQLGVSMQASPLVSLLMSMFSVIVPSKMWYSPTQPLMMTVDSKTPTAFILTKFDGSPVAARGSTDATAGTPVDLRTIFPDLNQVGTYVLFAVPKGKTAADFEGTPIVLEVLAEKGQTDPSVIRVEPLRYEVMTTESGPMTMDFYYDVAPNTVDSFLRLSSEGYYDGLTFHRIMPDFMLQGGDPKGDGSGGPGFGVNAEFNTKQHLEGVLSMARQGDEGESSGAMPGPVAANSAGSQFFVCLNYNSTKHLDGRYTAFGKVVEGNDVMQKLRATPLKANGETPVKPPVIQKAEVFPVTPGHNPYASMGLGK